MGLFSEKEVCDLKTIAKAEWKVQETHPTHNHPRSSSSCLLHLGLLLGLLFNHGESV
jgi:hypothetical protein